MKKDFYVFARIALAFLFLTSLGSFSPSQYVDPTNVVFTPGSSGDAGVLTWDDSNLGADAPEFVVESTDDGGTTWTQLGTVPHTGLSSTGSFSYNVTGLTDGSTYRFRVKLAPTSGTDPNAESGYTESGDYTVSLLSGSILIGINGFDHKYIGIAVTNNTTGSDGIAILYKAAGDASWTVYVDDFIVDGATKNYLVQPLKANTYYTFRAIAYKGASYNTLTKMLVGDTSAPVKTNRDFPPKPEYFNVALSCPNIATFNLSYADPSQIDEIQIRSLEAGVHYYGNGGEKTVQLYLEPGVTYHFTLVSINETGATNSDTYTYMSPAYQPPIPVTTLYPPTDITTNSMKVVWENPPQDLGCDDKIRSVHVVTYKITTREGQVENRSIEIPGDYNAVVLEDLPMKAVVEISMLQIDHKRGLVSRSPITVTGVTLGPPYAPTNLLIESQKDVLSNNENLLSWIDNADDENSYVVELAKEDGSFKELVEIVFDQTQWIHKFVEEGKTYTYKVKARNQYGDSYYSETVSFTVPYTKEPNMPYGLLGTIGTGQVDLVWRDDSNKENKFLVERSANGGETWEQIGETGRNETSYSDTNVTAGEVYMYRIKAQNEAGTSDASKSITVAYTEAVGVTVFPNPTVDVINLRIAGETTQINLIDQNNRTVLNRTIQLRNGEGSFDISSLKPGAYQMVIITDTNQKVSRKIYKY